MQNIGSKGVSLLLTEVTEEFCKLKKLPQLYDWYL